MTEEAERRIDTIDVTKLHTQVFQLQTNVGPITLRALTRLKAKRVGQALLMADPQYAEYVKEYQYLNDIANYPDGLDEEQVARRADLTRLLSEWSDWFAIECFVNPALEHPEELDNLSNELDNESFNQLDEMLAVLANPMPMTDVMREIGEICVKYGVPLADGLTAENITIQQTTVLDEARMAEQETMARILEDAEIGHSG